MILAGTDTDRAQRSDAPTTAPSRASPISVPKGGGAIRGISEKLNVNAANGTANLSVPLPFSASRSGFNPDLHIGYDSGSSNGPFGMGWKIDLPAITRRSDKGLPRYYDGLESDIFMLSDSEDLVPLPDGTGARVQGQRTVHGVTYDIFPYLPRVEGLYARIERWVATASGATHWRTISGDNVTTLYGFDSNSTISSGGNPDQAFSYLICRRFDGTGNLAVFAYAQENDENVDLEATHEVNRLPEDRKRERYLKSVRYGFTRPYFEDWSQNGPVPALPADWHFELVLDYGEHDANMPKPDDALARPLRPDPFSNHRSGYEVRTYRRCLRALMFHHFEAETDVGRDCLVRALELQYDDQQTPPDPGAPIYSFLTSITLAGFRRDGAGYLRKTYPPLEFDYSKPVIDPTVHTLPRDSLENLPQGVDGAKFRFIDLDAEGMPGVLSDDGTAWRYRRNLSPLSGAPKPDGSEPRISASFEPLGTAAELPSSHALHGGVRFMDVRGEGRVNAVSFDQSNPGFWAREPDIGWNSFVPFRSRPTIDVAGHNVHFVDLTGDGCTDILVGEDNLWTMYPSLGEKGFGPAARLPAPWDERNGGPPIYTTEDEAMQLADMTGDGLADIVRIRNGEVCFWPSLGYGRFGRKVTMEGSPKFAMPDQFDPRRLHLVDIDGSGTSDLLYVGGDGVRVWFNRSGNSWSEPQRIAVFPTADMLSSVQTADLLGNGTGCLVWSSPLPGQSKAPLRYIDLMSGQKPHLLVRTRNNLGAETRLHYAPSTRFYLEDRRAGLPWITHLPFPVQVVERMEVFDWISRSRYVTRHAYHHGHYDSEEREFRGFGMVETWDTETHRADSAFPDGENWDLTSWSPPTHTKTWYHTGVFLEEGLISRQFENEYWIEPALRPEAHAAERSAMELPDSTIPTGLSGFEAREACRALRGLALRAETYSEDNTPRAALPFDVVEHNYEVRRIQPAGPNRHAVFAPHKRETLSFHYDRVADDPRVEHRVVLEVDPYDHPLREVAIIYPRRAGYAEPEPALPTNFRQMLAYDQTRLHVMGTKYDFTLPAFADDAHRLPMPCETVIAELAGLAPASARVGITNLFKFGELDASWTTAWNVAHDIPYEQVAAADINGVGAPPAGPSRRIVGHERTLYRSDDLTALLALGAIQPLALPGDTYRLALTPALLSRVLAGLVGVAELMEGGYVQLPASSDWWIPGERVRFSPSDADTPAAELAYAKQHFFLGRCRIDAFGGVHRIDFDAYDLLPIRAVEPNGNTHSSTNDYRVLQPLQVIDPNGNRGDVVFDALGHVTGSAVRGKVTESLGDSLTGFVSDLDDATIAAHLADPLTNPLAVLQDASARLIYDLDAYHRTRDQPQPSAPVTYMIERETHVSDLAPSAATLYRHEFAYSDGNARLIQKKVQAEPGPVTDGGPDVAPRWIGSGWTIKDNKGRPVRHYEPFFTATHHFEFSPISGVSDITFYDPVGRVVGVLHPDNTWQKTVRSPWRQEVWDGNDTVLISDPRTDPDVGDCFTRLLGNVPGAFTSWHDARIGGAFGSDAKDKTAEQHAAQKAAMHAATPGVEHLDPLGRQCLAVKDFGTGGRQPTRTVYDAEGKQFATIDALGRRVVEYLVREPSGSGFHYVAGRDLAGRDLFHNQMDGGERRMLCDVEGHPIRSWDARGHAARLRYDANRRPTHRYVKTGAGPEHLVARTVYGEGHADKNLCGQIFRYYDQSGVTSNESCDFKGNLIDRARHLALDYRNEVDWSVLGDETDPTTLDALGAPLLAAGDRFVSRALHDALNRPFFAVTPHSASMHPNIIQVTFNEGGKPEKVDMWEQALIVPATPLDPATADSHVVTASEYDANGKRISVTHGNGTIVNHKFDNLTKRLVRVLSTRPGSFAADERVVQDLRYTYDPHGNVTCTRDDADIQDVVFFRNKRVEPSSRFTYDAGYRLTRATGREHLGQIAGSLLPPSQPGDDESGRTGLPNPGDGTAMDTYVETYEFDAVSNILAMFHQVSSGNWRRRYVYAEPSQIDAAATCNRLSTTSLPGDPDGGPYSAHYGYDAHGNSVTMPHLSLMAWNEQDGLQATARQVIANGTPETTFYTYDLADRRIRKVTDRASSAGPGVRRCERIYLGALEIYREYAADGVTVTLRRETQIIAAERKTAAVLERRTIGSSPAPERVLKYQYLNLIGSSCLELDDTSAVISYEEYFPYGGTSYQAVASATETSKRLRYCGLERDSENGFYYAAARYYAPWLARWINPDPKLLIDGPNLYLYVRANPVVIVDPTGTVGLVAVALLEVGAYLFVAAGTGVVVVSALKNKQRSDFSTPYSTGWDYPVTPFVVTPKTPVQPSTVPDKSPGTKAPSTEAPPIAVAPPITGTGSKTDTQPKTGTQPKDNNKSKPDPKDKPGKPLVPPGESDKPRETYWYITYTKTKVVDGKQLIYVGHTTGYGVNPYSAMAKSRPDKSHHMSKKGYGPKVIDTALPATLPKEEKKSDPSYWAMRGREQQMIDSFGGALTDPNRKPDSQSGNPNRAVDKNNPMGPIYHLTASLAFGNLAPYTGR